MPIKVACKCGQSFMAKDELEGQTLLCPKCHQPITIHAEGHQPHHKDGGMAELFDEVGLKEHTGHRCPQCQAPLKPNALLCVSCGLNLQTGEKISGAKVRKAGERGHGEAADVLLDRAADRILEDKLEEKKTRSQGLPAWVYFLLLAGILSFVGAMFLIPKERAFLISGWTLFGFGALAAMYFQVRIIIAAFYESTTCGLLYLFLPFYSLYFIFTRWDEVGTYFLLTVASNIVSSLGQGAIAVAPMMAGEDGGGEQVQLPVAPPSAVVRVASDSELYWS